MPKAVNKRLEPKRYEQISKLSARLVDLRERIIIHIDQLRKKEKGITAKGLSDFIAQEDVTEEKIPTAIGAYLEWLIARMKDGSFKYGSMRYDADTIKVWVVFKNVYYRFEKEFEEKTGRVLIWETLDKVTMDAFVKYLEDYGYLTKTINKYIENNKQYNLNTKHMPKAEKKAFLISLPDARFIRK